MIYTEVFNLRAYTNMMMADSAIRINKKIYVNWNDSVLYVNPLSSSMIPPATDPEALPTNCMSCFIPMPVAISSEGRMRDTSFVVLDERLEKPKLVNI